MPPRVSIVAMYGGAHGRLVDAAVESKAAGVVAIVDGVGNVNASMCEALKRACEKGIPVVISSWVQHGRVRAKYGFKSGSKTLAKLGVVSANDLSPKKAKILIMLTMGPLKIRRKFKKFLTSKMSCQLKCPQSLALRPHCRFTNC